RRIGSSPSRSKLQGEDAAKLVLGFRVVGEKGIGAIDQDASKLEGLSGKAEHPVTALQHLRPHIVERIRQQRQGTDVLDRILRGAPGNDVRNFSGLEPS